VADTRNVSPPETHHAARGWRPQQPYGYGIERRWWDGTIDGRERAGRARPRSRDVKVAQEDQIGSTVALDAVGTLHGEPDRVDGHDNVSDSIPG
jgi:hypothetical protein